MEFTKDEVKNLIHMLNSKDEENNYLALQCLENTDLKDKEGELIVAYKFGKRSLKFWEDNAPKAASILKKYFKEDMNLTSGLCLSIMTHKKCSKDSIELFIEYVVKDLGNTLHQLGFPVDVLDLNIKLKNNE